MNTIFYSEVIRVVRDYVDNEHQSNVAQAAIALGIHGDSLAKWLSTGKNKRCPSVDSIGVIMDKLGYSVCKTGDISNESNMFELCKIKEEYAAEQIASLKRENELLRKLLGNYEKIEKGVAPKSPCVPAREKSLASS